MPFPRLYSLWMWTCLLMVHVELPAQYINFRHLGISEGLPSSHCYALHQDQMGYIWFGTNAGAARYNGSEMVTFGVGEGLPSNEILGFVEDSKGRLWMRNYVG
ncbi:MAG: two-component regulator propeller domain-containing protein, partial [Bacteroidota bacterium]